MADIANLVSPSALKARLKNNPGGAYVFCGRENYLKLSYLNAFKKKVVDDGLFDLNYTYLDLSDGNFEPLEEAANLLPSMGPVRMIEARFLFASKMEDREYKRLTSILSDVPDYLILIIYVDSGELDVDSDKKIFSKKPFTMLLKYATVVNFGVQGQRELVNWAGKMFYREHIAINEPDVAALIDLCDGDMFVIENEASKLIAYSKKHGIERITKNHIEEMVVSRKEQQFWSFTDALFGKRFKEAACLYEEQKAKKVPPHILLFNIQKALSNMLYIKKAREKNMAPGDISAAIGVFNYPFKKLCEQERGFSADVLREALSDAFRCNVMLNSAKTDSYFLFEEFFLSLIRRMRGEK